MAARPIDIARRLGISTTTLRHYEERGLIPPVSRSAAGYRLYTAEHIAYFVCIREMLPGFSLTLITKVLREVMAKTVESALWMVTKAQATLHQDKLVSEKLILNLLHKDDRPTNTKQRLTIHDVSRETGVPASTIRFWDKMGLLVVGRSHENNYRLFTSEHIRQILTIYALKFSVYSKYRRHSIERVKAELKDFDYDDSDRIETLAKEMRQQLDQVNHAQIKGIVALYRLCDQVISNQFDDHWL